MTESQKHNLGEALVYSAKAMLESASLLVSSYPNIAFATAQLATEELGRLFSILKSNDKVGEASIRKSNHKDKLKEHILFLRDITVVGKRKYFAIMSDIVEVRLQPNDEKNFGNIVKIIGDFRENCLYVQPENYTKDEESFKQPHEYATGKNEHIKELIELIKDYLNLYNNMLAGQRKKLRYFNSKK